MSKVTVKLFQKQALTFIEAMVAMAILSFGIVSLYKAFFLSLDYVDHYAYRLYADQLMENRIEVMQKAYESRNEIALDYPQNVHVVFDGRPVDYYFKTGFHNVSDVKNIFRLEISISWKERGREVQISRSTYLASLQ